MKDRLFDVLSAFCDIGTKGAFNTRLTLMRKAKLVDWEPGKHNQPVRLLPKGAARLHELVGPDGASLSTEQLECLRQFLSNLKPPPKH